jgi:Septum formation
MRDERPERERYQHAGLLDQARGELENLRRQPKLLLLLALLFGGFVLLKVMEPPVVQVEALQAGDCIYVPNPGAGEVQGVRAIGSSADVVYGILHAGAERAPCDASHSHEVAAVFRLQDLAGTTYPGPGVLADRQQPVCEAAFVTYVGRPVAGSAFELTVVVPRDVDWAKGRRAGACLVSRADGSFLSTRVAGSGQ